MDKAMVVNCCQCDAELDESKQTIYWSPLDDAPYCEYCSPENEVPAALSKAEGKGDEHGK